MKFFLLWRKHPWIDFTGRTGIRFCDQNRIAIDPDWFLIAIAIAVSKSGSNFTFRLYLRFQNRFSIAIRFADKNRRSILPGKSGSDCAMKTDYRFSGMVFDSDCSFMLCRKTFDINHDALAGFEEH
jgi:hypothetical protein